MAKVTYIGTVGDETDVLIQDGLTFEKGKAVEVADDHPRLQKYANNPTFKVEASAKTEKKG